MFRISRSSLLDPVPPVLIHFIGVFLNHPFLGTPILGNPHMIHYWYYMMPYDTLLIHYCFPKPSIFLNHWILDFFKIFSSHPFHRIVPKPSIFVTMKTTESPFPDPLGASRCTERTALLKRSSAMIRVLRSSQITTSHGGKLGKPGGKPGETPEENEGT